MTMARMYNFGFMEFDHMLDRLEKIPEPTKNSMMRAAGEEYKKHTEKTAATMGVEGYTNTRTGKSGGGGKYSRGSGGIRSKLVLKKQDFIRVNNKNEVTLTPKGKLLTLSQGVNPLMLATLLYDEAFEGMNPKEICQMAGYLAGSETFTAAAAGISASATGFSAEPVTHLSLELSKINILR